jgi:hypothetical protein
VTVDAVHSRTGIDRRQVGRAFLGLPAIEQVGAVFLEVQVEHLALVLVDIVLLEGILEAEFGQAASTACGGLSGSVARNTPKVLPGGLAATSTS